jgi:hypothetical protein
MVWSMTLSSASSVNRVTCLPSSLPGGHLAGPLGVFLGSSLAQATEQKVAWSLLRVYARGGRFDLRHWRRGHWQELIYSSHPRPLGSLIKVLDTDHYHQLPATAAQACGLPTDEAAAAALLLDIFALDEAREPQSRLSPRLEYLPWARPVLRYRLVYFTPRGDARRPIQHYRHASSFEALELLTLAILRSNIGRTQATRRP